MKIFEYERVHLGDRPHIHIESIEDKVKFLVQVLKRLRELYISDAENRINDQKEQLLKEHGDKSKTEVSVKYPVLPPKAELEKMVALDRQVVGKDITLK